MSFLHSFILSHRITVATLHHIPYEQQHSFHCHWPLPSFRAKVPWSWNHGTNKECSRHHHFLTRQLTHAPSANNNGKLLLQSAKTKSLGWVHSCSHFCRFLLTGLYIFKRLMEIRPLALKQIHPLWADNPQIYLLSISGSKLGFFLKQSGYRTVHPAEPALTLNQYS